MERSKRKGRSFEDREEVPSEIEQAGDRDSGEPSDGGAEAPPRATRGRTVGGAATSYTSVGGARASEERSQPAPPPDDDAPDYETPGGAQPAGTGTGPVHDLSFRPRPGGVVESAGRRGQQLPFTGEAASTRDAPFDENPDTGRTAEEEREAILHQSLEKQTRGHESG
jgi:hypothetical protein